MKINIQKFSKKKKIIIFDFDGVIKDSVEVKGFAFQKLFIKHKNIQEKIIKYHIQHNGVNRDKKIKKFLEWSGENINKFEVYKKKFSKIVVEEVINSQWIRGVKKFIYLNRGKQLFLLSATPHKEIIKILKQLNLKIYFKDIYGFPYKKNKVVASIIKTTQQDKDKIFLIGDSNTDYTAAKINKIDFVLRKAEYNKSLHKKNIKYINNFNYK